MGNKRWVNKYINKIYSCDLDSESDEVFQEKLNYINLPLYKYFSINESEDLEKNYSIKNFINDEIFFQNPEKFNDPFDCFLGSDIKNMVVSEIKRENMYSHNVERAIKDFFKEGIEKNEKNLMSDVFYESYLQKLEELKNANITGAEFVILVMKIILSNDRGLFCKLVNDRLTIRDKKEIISMLFGNDMFRAYSKRNINVNNQEAALDRSEKLFKSKIEIQPNWFLGERIDNNLDLIDYIKHFTDTVLGKNTSEEYKKMKRITIKNNKMTEGFRIACFSERMDSPLMWSHYASKHFGFCLEYDFTHTMVADMYPDLKIAQLMLFPVIYTKTRPSASKIFLNFGENKESLKNILEKNHIRDIVMGYLKKSDIWRYEKEWRIIYYIDDKPTLKLPSARKVFLGANIEEKAKEMIIEIAKNKYIPVYQMCLSNNKYKLDYFRVI